MGYLDTIGKVFAGAIFIYILFAVGGAHFDCSLWTAEGRVGFSLFTGSWAIVCVTWDVVNG